MKNFWINALFLTAASTHAFAVEMNCNGKILEYSSLFGFSPSVEIRENGVWEEYCKPEKAQKIDCIEGSGLKDCRYGPVRKSFGDDSVKCEIDHWSLVTNKGESWTFKNQVHVYDFRFLKYSQFYQYRRGDSEWFTDDNEHTCIFLK